ncbi:MAG: hypothetical protein ACI4U9_00770 [Clostridia bacterium]
MNQKEKRIIQANGITLVSLVITIIIMLILVTVTISMTINRGLFDYAEKSKFVTDVSAIKEELMQKTIMAEMADNEIEDNPIDVALGKETGYNDKLLVQDGELVYDGNNVTEKQKEWLDEMGVHKIIKGNYVVDETSDYYTLQEAIDNAQDGSTIKVIKDATETTDIVFNKSITLNINEKTINCTRIEISENVDVAINGDGTILGNPLASFIINNGNLETNNVTINSSAKGYLSSTITNMRKFNF